MWARELVKRDVKKVEVLIAFFTSAFAVKTSL